MPELTIIQAVVLAAVLVELALFMAARKLALDFRVYRALGVVALAVGLPVLGWLGYHAGQLAWHSAWRAAAEHALLLYVLGMATWLGWRESKPF
ncbi:hypothetical protein WJ96_07570 [Burkholderia ubonensis]|uniref:DUF2568 domain-containing protein n=1 Tax=Burkholderia ubonensis TaxID=101571 RepID=A0AAW3MZG5_9BURK|nr:hypothetical protein [Burkholderia ubonensis]KVP75557.1 hypothetical protein WJ93_09365 [Burkholderia ubonensis]KVP98370.1 hypothetical protein WJ96_07570 [Burkholderia ubonensis]KVZ93068.1 hypothetical protein WL25_19230 [Burkholderia ubonensis]